LFIFVVVVIVIQEGAISQKTNKLSLKTVRAYLAIFSTAAPLFSLLTYALLHGYQLETPQHIWTGLVLLFSAGSFLYVATIHVLPEIMSGHSHGGHADHHSRSLTTVKFSPPFCGRSFDLI
jgi:zinc transporter ZupT